MTYWGPQGPQQHTETTLPLLELPKALKDHGYSTMQLCHFHLPSRDPAYAEQFKAALGEAGVQLLTVLIDDGDPSDAATGESSAEWMVSWVQTAARLGATRARVIAGRRAYTEDNMSTVVRNLRTVAEQAVQAGIRLETENWHPLLMTPAAVFELLDLLSRRIGLCVDFANWPRTTALQKLPFIMWRAETVHAKFEFLTPTQLDEEFGAACLQICKNAGYKGPMVLVNGGMGGDPWEALDLQRRFILAA